jgi:hypothetical protein
MELLEGMRNDCTEGNISLFPERQYTITDLILNHKPRTILEIGFNMGHSMLLICQALVKLIEEDSSFNEEPIQVFVFDLNEYECTVHNFDILQKHFLKWNIHLFMVTGNSNGTVPLFLKEYDGNFDFVEVDGCHYYMCARQDIMNVINRINDNGIIYVDDYKSTKGPLPDVDKVVDDIDWKGFNTYYIDGVFWAHKQNKIPNQLNEQVNHPNHYGGETNPYEAIKVIDAWDLGFSLGNTVKYISRAGKKNKDKELEDLKKALWYLQHHIETLEKK